jgi:hypothetical protein
VPAARTHKVEVTLETLAVANPRATAQTRPPSPVAVAVVARMDPPTMIRMDQVAATLMALVVARVAKALTGHPTIRTGRPTTTTLTDRPTITRTDPQVVVAITLMALAVAKVLAECPTTHMDPRTTTPTARPTITPMGPQVVVVARVAKALVEHPTTTDRLTTITRMGRPITIVTAPASRAVAVRAVDTVDPTTILTVCIT